MKIGIIYTIEFECILNGLACLALFSIFCNFLRKLSCSQFYTENFCKNYRICKQKKFRNRKFSKLAILQKLSVNLYFFTNISCLLHSCCLFSFIDINQLTQVKTPTPGLMADGILDTITTQHDHCQTITPFISTV